MCTSKCAVISGVNRALSANALNMHFMYEFSIAFCLMVVYRLDCYRVDRRVDHQWRHHVGRYRHRVRLCPDDS